MVKCTFRGKFPFGPTRRQIREAGEAVEKYCINTDIPYVMSRLQHENFFLETGVLMYAFRLPSITLLVAWDHVKPSMRLHLCAIHVEG